jgi:mannan endo-1,4-beta-mannosidase
MLPAPGSGSQCEGEDWVKISQLANIDIATLHLYERHMEELPPPDLHYSWIHCNFSCMMDWMPKYLQVGAHHMPLLDSNSAG